MKIIENSYLTPFSKKEMENCDQKKTVWMGKIKEWIGNVMTENFHLNIPIDYA